MDNYSNSDQTQDWILFDNGKRYNNMLKPPYYATVDNNIAFVAGDQWRGVQANGMPTPVFNIIKRCITFFVASLTSSKIAIQYEPLAYNQETNNDPTMEAHNEASKIATAEIGNLFDKFKFDNKVREACSNAATIGDVAAHMYFDPNKQPYGGMLGQDIKGEICFELVDGTNVMLGNPNNPSTDVNIQPYIIIIGRDTVENLKREAKRYKANQTDIDSITRDSMYEYQAGDASRIEIQGDEFGKALYIYVYKYDHESKTVKVSKCTQNVYMFKDVDTGLSYYPVARFLWEKQFNQSHGRAVCTGLIPNQIFINRMFAMVMYHLMNAAFPKAVYNADKITDWNNEIGSAIPLSNLDIGESVTNVAGYLQPGNMSNQIVQVIELAIQYTKETLGITDAQMGNVNPEQASGASIAQSVKQASVPIENVKANLYEWVEDIGKILLDMMGTYYGARPIVLNEKGVKSIVPFDFSQLKNIWLNCKCEVGPSSYWSEMASVQTLDNLLKDGMIELLDYLEALPDGYLSNKQDLIDKIKAKQEAMAQQQMQQQEMQQQEQMAGSQVQQLHHEKMAQFVESLPKDIQAKLKSLPDAQYEQSVMRLMEQTQQMQGGGNNG